MHRLKSAILVIGLLLALSAACAAPTPSPSDQLSSVVKDIFRDAAQLENQTVTITGYFRGLDALDEVAGVPPTGAYKDWVIKDASAAIYVAGSDKLPFAVTSQDIWRVLRVTGTVKILVTQTMRMPYIVPQEIVWESRKESYTVLPAHALIAIHRLDNGGQPDYQVLIYDNRKLLVNDFKNSLKKSVGYNEDNMNKLLRGFEQSGFYDLPETPTEACPDCVRYMIAAVHSRSGYPHYALVYEGRAPAKLQTWLEQVFKKADAAQIVQ